MAQSKSHTHQEKTVDEISTLDIEDIQTLRSEKKNAFDALISEESPTDQTVAEAKGLAAELDAIDAELASRAAKEQERADEFAALRERQFAGDAVEETPEPEPTDEVEDEPTDEPEEQPEAETKEEPVAAATRAPVTTRPASAAKIAAQVKRPVIPEPEGSKVTITAAANVGTVPSGSEIPDLTSLGKAAVSVMKGFPKPTGTREGAEPDLRKFGVANIALPFDDAHTINLHDSDEATFNKFNDAGTESNLPGGSLVAAGGWCAPSETLYDLPADETREGILDLPEVQVNRGGIRFTLGPQFADFYAEAGFVQTEAQAIAGTAKPCYEVDCPTFTEVRLDAVGVCIKVPILTNAAYPELVNRFTSGTLIAHDHMVNANVIGRLVTSAGAARVFTGGGSTLIDALGALELVILQRRQIHRLSLTRAMEVVVPFWTRGTFRADLAARNGRPNASVSDAELDEHFRNIGANVQFVYDWQDLTTTDEAYPASFNALVYPAGTFVKGVSDVISLSAVYDAASLATNVYTGLFAEQGLLVARRQYAADLVTIPIESYGRSGRTDFGAANA